MTQEKQKTGGDSGLPEPSARSRLIYCCGCSGDTEARLTDGREIYWHRPDLHNLPFWKCDKCGNHVGCHHKTEDRTRPLGNIPTEEIRRLRQRIHGFLDPLWKSGSISRGELYRRIAQRLGVSEYHTGEIKTVSEAHEVLTIVKGMV